MSIRTRVLAAAAALSLVAVPLAAQQPAGLMADLIRDVNGVESKLVRLARAMPPEALAWRPGAEVRSSGEVFLHLASDNYLLPAAVGLEPPAATGIDIADFSTLTKFEKQQMSRDEMVAAVEQSFAHLRTAMTGTTEAQLDSTVKLFGQDMTVRYVWVITATHLHEHLGQLIAYARSNGIVPPWSRPAP